MAVSSEHERHRQLIREQFNAEIVVRLHRGSSTRMHLPVEDDDQESDDPQPVCGYVASGGSGWTQKPLAVYPPGYKALCERCAEVFDE